MRSVLMKKQATSPTEPAEMIQNVLSLIYQRFLDITPEDIDNMEPSELILFWLDVSSVLLSLATPENGDREHHKNLKLRRCRLR
jgi:hypothetical protein